MRQLRAAEEQTQRAAVDHMSATFAALEQVRNGTRQRTTDVILNLATKQPDPAEAERRLDEEVEAGVGAMAAAHAQREGGAVAEWMRVRDELLRRRQLTENRASADPQEIRAAAAAVAAHEAAPYVRRPFDVQAAQLEARSRLRRSGFAQPELVPILAHAALQEAAAPSPEEVARRRQVTRTRFFGELVVNGKKVGITEDAELRLDFTLAFGSAFSLTLRRWPETVSLRVFERPPFIGSIAPSLVAEVFLAVPGTGVDAPPADPKAKPYQFASSDAFGPVWGHMEENRRRTSAPTTRAAPIVYYPAGAVWVQSSWKAKGRTSVRGGSRRDAEKGDPLMPPLPPGMSHAGAAWQAAALVRGDARASLRDPNDPRDRHMDELERTTAAGPQAPDAFRIESDAAEAALGSVGEGARRTRVLKRRWAKELRDVTEVPLVEREIPVDLVEEGRSLVGVEYAVALRNEGADVTSSAVGDTAESIRRVKIEDFKMRVRNNLARARRSTAGGASGSRIGSRLEDFVTDVPPISLLKLDFSFIVHALRPRRRFKPDRTRPKVVSALPESVEVLVGIRHATGLPRRVPKYMQREQMGGPGARQGYGGYASPGMMSPGYDQYGRRRPAGSMPTPGGYGGGAAGGMPREGGEDDQAPMNTFAEVRLQSIVSTTKRVTGDTPAWNEQLVVPFAIPEGYSTPSEMRHCREALTIAIFDEVYIQEDGADGPVDTAVRRFLGKVEITLGSVYRQPDGILDCTLTLDVPVVCVGYMGAPDNKPAELTVHILMRPSLSRPVAAEDGGAAAGEESGIAALAAEWWRDLSALPYCHERGYKAMATDVRGGSVFLPRFVTKLQPPRLLLQPPSDASLRRLMRFVSLIPFLED